MTRVSQLFPTATNYGQRMNIESRLDFDGLPNYNLIHVYLLAIEFRRCPLLLRTSSYRDYSYIKVIPGFRVHVWLLSISNAQAAKLKRAMSANSGMVSPKFGDLGSPRPQVSLFLKLRNYQKPNCLISDV